MAPPKRPWFRFYVEALTDPKLRRLSAEERWLWVVCLGLARQSPVPGWLLVTESIPMEPDDMSEMAGMTAARVGKGLSKMVDLGLLIHDKGGAYRVAKWDERQFESDDVAKRTAKHRSKNVEATAMERPNDVDVSAPDTETESETESSSSSVPTSEELDDPDDEEILKKFLSLKLAARKLAPGFGPVIDDAAWLAEARTRAINNGVDFAIAEHRSTFHEASASELARFLFDGTEPPKPPKVFTHECGDELVGIDAYSDHLAECDFTPADALPVGSSSEGPR